MGAGSKLLALLYFAYNFTTTRATLSLFAVAGVIESLCTFIPRIQFGESHVERYKCCHGKKVVRVIMDHEQLERCLIMAVLEESDSDDMPSDQESGEDDDHVNERSEATNTEQEISDDDEVPLAIIRRRVQSEANLQQEEYASTSLSTRDCEYTRQYFGKDGTA
ncbi:hypothetical protein evm_002674 [Chilo suppressalis]|nr:hypothetical protein evm_002674 [Chilo suppressalis]